MTNKVQHRSWMISGIRLRGATAALALAAVLVAGGVANSAQAQDQDYVVLHNFNGIDGRAAMAGLIQDANGNLYGTTPAGGATSCGIPNQGCGTVFKLDTTGALTVLHTFTGGADGAIPYGRLNLDPSGVLYGTTVYGGDAECLPPSHAPSGCGTIFKVDTAGTETVLYAFQGMPDGATPPGGLIEDSAGNLYGVTAQGGTHHSTTGGGVHGWGTVFKLEPTTNRESTLHSFGGPGDGKESPPPPGGYELVRDVKGNFYGTTFNVLSNSSGTVFKLNHLTYKETILHHFYNPPDGLIPVGGLVRDGQGNFYGVTSAGGKYGYGAVFRIDTTGKETVLHTFHTTAEGRSPSGGLTRDSAGNLYGVAGVGEPYQRGIIFKLDPAGNFTVLYALNGTTDGGYPLSRLVLDSAGNLYGTASTGGTYGYGVIFELKP